MRIKYSFTVDVDPYAIWAHANDKLRDVQCLSVEEREDWIGTQEEPDVHACLFEVFDPDNQALPGVTYVSRDSEEVAT